MERREDQKRATPFVFAHKTDGGDKGSRTPDLLNAIETLYQLSYIPKKENVHMVSKYRGECKCFLFKFLMW